MPHHDWLPEDMDDSPVREGLRHGIAAVVVGTLLLLAMLALPALLAVEAGWTP